MKRDEEEILIGQMLFELRETKRDHACHQIRLAHIGEYFEKLGKGLQKQSLADLQTDYKSIEPRSYLQRDFLKAVESGKLFDYLSDEIQALDKTENRIAELTRILQQMHLL